jgi:hypothetical protein
MGRAYLCESYEGEMQRVPFQAGSGFGIWGWVGEAILDYGVAL